MATREQLERALRNADAAGDADAARALAGELRNVMQSGGRAAGQDAGDFAGLPGVDEQPAPAPAAAPERTALETVDRYAGLVNRGIVGAPLELGAMVADAAAYPVNRIAEAVSGRELIPSYQQSLDDGLDSVFPEPETAGERVVTATAGGVSGAGTGVALARQAAQSARPVVAAVGRSLAQNPLTQLVSGGSAGTGGQVAAEVSDNPLVQLAGTVAGGFAGGAASMPRRAATPSQRIDPTVGDLGGARAQAEMIERSAQDAAQKIGIDWGAIDDALKASIRSNIARAQQTSDIPPEAAARAALYESLNLTSTRGMATRQLGDARNEQILMQQPEGGALRDTYAQNNEAIRQNIRSLAPEGVAAADAPTFGQQFRAPIAEGERRAQKLTNAAYRRAEEAEGGNLTTVQPLVDHLQQNLPMLEATDAAKPVIAYLRQSGIISPQNMDAIATPGATFPVGVGFNAANLNLRELAGLRRVVNQVWSGATKRGDDLAAHQLNQMRGFIDEAEGAAGGDLYNAYRKLRRGKAERYEDNPLIDKLISDQKGYRGTDLIEDSQVFDKAVLSSTTEQFGKVWPRLTPKAKDLTRAQVAKYIEERAFSNMGTNEGGDIVASAAKLNQAISSINPQKLDLIFGKEKSRQLNSLNTALREISNPVRGSVPSGSAPMLDHLARGIFSVLRGVPLIGDTVVKQAGDVMTSRRNAAAVNEALDFIPRNAQPPRELTSNRLLQLAAPVGYGAAAIQE